MKNKNQCPWFLTLFGISCILSSPSFSDTPIFDVRDSRPHVTHPSDHHHPSHESFRIPRDRYFPSIHTSAWSWHRIRTVSCTAVDARNIPFVYTESRYSGNQYQAHMNSIAWEAMNKCWRMSIYPSSCSFTGCNHAEFSDTHPGGTIVIRRK